MTYDSKPFLDDDLSAQTSEDGIARTLFPSLTARGNAREDWAHSDGAGDQAHARDPEFDLISDAQIACGTNGARSVCESNAKAIVFIDSGVTDINHIVSAASIDAEIVMLDATSDGIGQITGHLRGRCGIEMVHIVSKGTPGELQLGNSTLSLSSIVGAHRAELTTIGSSLAPDACIIVCGGDALASMPGKIFVQAIATVTGASVHSSEDPGGPRAPGGDRRNEICQDAIGAVISVAPDWNRPLTPPVAGNDGLTIAAAGTSSGHRRLA